MTIKVTAILPKRKLNPNAIQGEIDRVLHAFAEDIQQEMSEYPPEQPWKSRTPKSGPRAGGRRTGAYGEGWRDAAHFTKSSVTIINRVSYASAVGGSHRQFPGQSRVLEARGWKSIQDVGPLVSKRHLPRFGNVIFTSKR